MSWPKNWTRTTLGDVAEVLSGFAFKSKDFNTDGKGMPLVRIRDVVSGATSTFFSGDFDPRFIVRCGDILVGMDGDFNRSRWASEEALLNQRVCKVSAAEGLDDGYLFHLLPQILQVISDRTPFVTVKHLSAKELKEYEIPLPPLEEQKRIAGILDQAAELYRLRTHALDKLNTLGQAIFHEMFGDPVANVKGLASVPLGDVATFQSGGTPSKDEERYWGGHIPWVTPKDMKRTWLKGAQDHVTEEALSTTSLKSVMAGTPLVVVRGMILAHTVPLAISEVDCTINQDMKAIHFDQRVDPVFGLFNLKCQHGSLLTRVSTAAHGTKRFDLSELRKAPVLLPDLDEQQRFVQALENTRAIRSCASAEAAQQEALFASLQHRAFKGEL